MQQLLRLTRAKYRSLQTPILLLILGPLLFVTACRTVAPFEIVDFTQVGWKIKSGQAVWKVNREAPEIAGDLMFATNPDGRTVLQMTKSPFPMVIAQLRSNSWQIEFPTEDRTYSGRGTPPKRLAWLHLANALQGDSPPEPWTFEKTGDTNWKFKNLKTGELIEGFLE